MERMNEWEYLLISKYLHEIGRLAPTAMRVIEELKGVIGLAICDLLLRTVVDLALSEKWSRDAFDRLIVSQARARATSLLAACVTIRPI